MCVLLCVMVDTCLKVRGQPQVLALVRHLVWDKVSVVHHCDWQISWLISFQVSSVSTSHLLTGTLRWQKHALGHLTSTWVLRFQSDTVKLLWCVPCSRSHLQAHYHCFLSAVLLFLLMIIETLVLVQILGCSCLLSHCVMTIECDGNHHKGEFSLLGLYYRMSLSFNSFHDICLSCEQSCIWKGISLGL